MRVLLINTVCGAGSTGKICEGLADILSNSGHDSVIAYGRQTSFLKKDRCETFAIDSRWEILSHALSSRIFDNQGLCSGRGTRALLQKIQAYEPDIIHLHNLHGYYINYLELFAFLKNYNKPVIWTLHDCWAITGHCAHFDYIGCNRWVRGCEKCPQKKEYPASYVFDMSKRNYELKKKSFSGVEKMILVTPSEWLKKIVEQSYLNEYKIQVINNGIDTDTFRPTKSDLRSKYGFADKKIVLGVSVGWAPAKHLDYLAKLSEDLIDTHIIVAIGVEKKVRDILPPQMIALGLITNPVELAQWYTEADVFVNPTMEDTYPTVNLEAQACGTPVVTFKTGGSPECIKEGYGVAVERENYNAFREAVIACSYLKNVAPAPHILSKGEYARKYLKLYEEVYEKS